MSDTEQRKSDLVKWREQQPRKFLDVPVEHLSNHDGAPVFTVRFWVNNQAEEDQAILISFNECERQAREKAGGAYELAQKDEHFVDSMKTAQALWRACRDPSDPTYPIFPDPVWFNANLTPDEIGYLLGVYNQVRLRLSGLEPKISDFEIAVWRQSCVAAVKSGAQLPERILKPMTREYMDTLFMRAMCSWQREREDLLGRVDELEQRLAAATAPATEQSPSAEEQPAPPAGG